MLVMRVLLFLLIFIGRAPAQTETRLKLVDIFKEVPKTSVSTLKTSFSQEALPGWAMIVGSTAILYNYDENLYRGSQQAGRSMGIGNEDNTRPVVTANGQELLRLPSDTGSAMYFLGDGWTHIAIAGSILGYGYASDKTYEVNTGIILVHGLLVSTIFNQTLKRSFGRESPEVKTQERGAWRPFPSFKEYNSRTGTYDAMPSGHVMTATLTFTILGERYAEHRTAIYSVGGVWISALMFQMMNNGVHWASDYPLGIAMGWVIGKAATKIVPSLKDEQKKEVSWNLFPISVPGGGGMLVTRMF